MDAAIPMTSHIVVDTPMGSHAGRGVEQERVWSRPVRDATFRDGPRVPPAQPRRGRPLVVPRVDPENLGLSDPQEIDGDEPGRQPESWLERRPEPVELTAREHLDCLTPDRGRTVDRLRLKTQRATNASAYQCK